nr:replication initiation protein [Microvirus sp.]
MDCLYPRSMVVCSKDGKSQLEGHRITVPCNHCIACRIRRTQEWSIRLLMEDTQWPCSCYLTLTYDDFHLPTTPCGKHPLDKEELRGFWKRLRAAIRRRDDSRRLRYYACGEYGDLFGRPHYHAIVFGIDFADEQDFKDANLAWQYRGKVDFKPVCASDIAYVCNYVSKKLFYDPMDELMEYGCVQPPFKTQSQGLALSFFEKDRKQFEKGYFVYKGCRRSIPRLFLKKDELLKQLVGNSFIENEYNEILNNIGRSRKDIEDDAKKQLMSRLQHNADLVAKHALRSRKF